MNFPGAKAYPFYPLGPTPMMDDIYRTKGREVSIPRGGTVEDYNVKLRGAETRIDRKPKRPYP